MAIVLDCKKCGKPLPPELIAHQRRWCQSCADVHTQHRKERRHLKRQKLLPTLFYLYILIDPRNSKPCYVGVAVNWKRRFVQHIADAKSGRGENPFKNDWILSLLSDGMKPVIFVVGKCPAHDIYDREKEAIRQLTLQGYKLLNILANP